MEALGGEFQDFLKEMLGRFLRHTQESLPRRLSFFGARDVIGNKVNGKGTQPPAPSCARVPLLQRGRRPGHTARFLPHAYLRAEVRVRPGVEESNSSWLGQVSHEVSIFKDQNIRSLLMKAPLLSHCQRLPLCPLPHLYCSLLPGHSNHPFVPFPGGLLPQST